jgi:hypothetical protein
LQAETAAGAAHAHLTRAEIILRIVDTSGYVPELEEAQRLHSTVSTAATSSTATAANARTAATAATALPRDAQHSEAAAALCATAEGACQATIAHLAAADTAITDLETLRVKVEDGLAAEEMRKRPTPPPLRVVPQGATSWEVIDSVPAKVCYLKPAYVPLVRNIPGALYEGWALAIAVVGELLPSATNEIERERALKWRAILPQLLLRRPLRGGTGSQEMSRLFKLFGDRRMNDLIGIWRAESTTWKNRSDRRGELTPQDRAHHERATVLELIAAGQISRATGRIASKGLLNPTAPGVAEQMRRKHPQRKRPLPLRAFDQSFPAAPVDFRGNIDLELHGLARLCAAGPNGQYAEHLRLLSGTLAPASAGRARNTMVTFAQMHTSGELPPWHYWLYSAANLVVLAKNEPEPDLITGIAPTPDARPLKVPLTERRLILRMVAKRITTNVMEITGNNCLGVGCEVATC